jgi:hypothetical protein
MGVLAKFYILCYYDGTKSINKKTMSTEATPMGSNETESVPQEGLIDLDFMKGVEMNSAGVAQAEQDQAAIAAALAAATESYDWSDGRNAEVRNTQRLDQRTTLNRPKSDSNTTNTAPRGAVFV